MTELPPASFPRRRESLNDYPRFQQAIPAYRRGDDGMEGREHGADTKIPFLLFFLAQRLAKPFTGVNLEIRA
ncbi:MULTISPECIES: hypothetical protein [unclassified Brenneria]|uniref:hypothetical protein n=1 Tax=unclassified Brenneria TaxID=2634434 RepID=UPI0029C2E28A|nr:MULTISPECIES: hypothetical protein [unclassified Brenneria]MDX5626583.1 hypothetical protein [Brenneria sp. L3-3Z]MDX5694067.1 hypothetical protein [Brenneria sp. L4-2C]